MAQEPKITIAATVTAVPASYLQVKTETSQLSYLPSDDPANWLPQKTA